MRDRPQQPAGVRVSRRREQPRDRRVLHHLPGVHDDHPPAQGGDDPQIVRDHDHREVQALHQLRDEVEDLGLDGHVERRRRLVRDQQPRVAGERLRDEHPLAHSPGELVRVGVHLAFRVRQAHPPQQLDAARPRLPPAEPPSAAASRGRAAAALVRQDRVHELLPHREDRVQVGHRVLEDHRDLHPAEGAEPRLAGRDQVLAAVEDAPGGDAGRRGGQQAEDALRGHRLAAARLADDAERFARREIEAHPVERAVCPVEGVELQAQVLDRQERGRGFVRPHGYPDLAVEGPERSPCVSPRAPAPLRLASCPAPPRSHAPALLRSRPAVGRTSRWRQEAWEAWMGETGAGEAPAGRKARGAEDAEGGRFAGHEPVSKSPSGILDHPSTMVIH